MTTESTPADPTNTSITASTPVANAPGSPAVANAPAVVADWTLRTDYLLLGLLLILSFLVASFTASNSDLWTHLAIGKRISEGKFEFGVDPFSYLTEAADGKPAVRWVHQSWLYSVLVYQIHESSLGGAGLIVFKAILFTLAIGLLSRIGWTAPNRWFLLICLVMAVLAVSSRLFMQPIVMSLFFLALTMFILDRVGLFALSGATPQAAEMKWLWALPPIFALWANFDAWFILGPLVLGLVWAASGLSRWFGSTGAIPGKTLGLVFGAGVLACVVNPYHVHVFQLPPELAYLVVAIADPLHLPIPGEIVAGGRTLKELRKVEPDLAWTMSSVFYEYWGDIRFGKNVAALAFYPLAILGLLAFALVALVKPQKDAPTFQVARFLLWLVFAAMALALFRMIPFFALVAAPLTAMTLGEFLIWQQSNAITAPEKRDRGLKLARFVSVPFLLLLLYLAWPGWLHGSSEFNSRRRVAWQTELDGSLQHAAETLQALKVDGKGNNVFNGDIELGNVLPWFAPDVKYAVDSRFALYAEQTKTYGQVRDALYGEKDEIDWQKLFAERKVDQIAMTRFINRDDLRRLMSWWLAPTQWRQRYADKRFVVASWAGPKEPWSRTSPSDDWNRQAFGDVPLAKRPPLRGITSPLSPGNWSLYFDGVGTRPAGIGEVEMLQLRYGFNNQFVQVLSPVCRMKAEAGAIATLPAVAGADLHAAYMAARYGWSFLNVNETGPPALPILMVRVARQALAENPLDPQAHLNLAEAIETLRNRQEDRWINYQGGQHPAPLRDRLRQIQQIVSRYHVVQLQPDNYEHHDRLAKLYLQQNLVDAALDHMQLAEKALEGHRNMVPADKSKGFDMAIAKYHDEVDSLDKNVKQRMAKWKELPAKTNYMKASLAFQGTFDMLMENKHVRTPFGLGKKSLELLGAIDPATLTPNERLDFVLLQFDLLVSMGRVDRLGEILQEESLKKNLPPAMYGQYQLLVAGALGDYETADQALTAIEKVSRERIQVLHAAALKLSAENVSTVLMAGLEDSAPALMGTLMVRVAPALEAPAKAGYAFQLARGELYNNMTLQATLLLEAGDTKKARTILQKAITEGHDAPFFTERPIARRYLQLLDGQ